MHDHHSVAKQPHHFDPARSVSRIVTALEKRGQAARKRNLKDSWMVSVYLTDDGRDAAANFGATPANERAAILSPLDTLVKAIRES